MWLVPLAKGEPAEGYPWHWSVYEWIEGEDAHPDRISDPCRVAADLAENRGTSLVVVVSRTATAARAALANRAVRGAVAGSGRAGEHAPAIVEAWSAGARTTN